jgi:hypothetical protein
MMAAQLDRHEVSEYVIRAGAAVASGLPPNLPAQTRPTDPQDEWRNRAVAGLTAGCAGLEDPVGETVH